MKLAWRLVAATGWLTMLGCGGGTDWSAPTGPKVPVSGRAAIFGDNPNNLSLTGATVAMTENPAVTTTVDANGNFSFQVPSGGPATFTLTQPGFHPNQSAAIDVGADGIPMLGFQAPTEMTFDSLAQIVNITPDPTRCQIATTVSKAGTSPYGGDALGEPDTVVSIDPPLPASSGPVYFDYAAGIIYPAPALTKTSVDGGVVFTNVPVGDYTLTATKAGKSFTTVDIRCRAGVLVNAAPPHGLQGL